jgi:hypothetical protein
LAAAYSIFTESGTQLVFDLIIGIPVNFAFWTLIAALLIWIWRLLTKA